MQLDADNDAGTIVDELLTTKEVQALLSVDRTTVYRMLKDGRLSGVKIGQQWRFPYHEIDLLLSGRTLFISPVTDHPLPVRDVQPIQDVFAELAEVGAVTTDLDGQPLTAISNSCAYCNMIRSTESGRQACSASWRELGQITEQQTDFYTCHAGLSYARARIDVTDSHPAMLVTGQFHADEPNWDGKKALARRTAVLHGLNEDKMVQAVTEISIFTPHKRSEIGTWLSKTAVALERIIRERLELVRRLQTIAQMSSID